MASWAGDPSFDLFQLPEEHQELRPAIRALSEKEIAPHAASTVTQIPSRCTVSTTGHAAPWPNGDRATSAVSSRRIATRSSSSRGHQPNPKESAGVHY